jgi:acyl dehydratase
MPVTLTRCVLDAAATRDFFPGHHDRDYARSQGAADAYVNTMFHQGFVDRIVTDWAGPQTWIARRRLWMRAPACVGETLTGSGRITNQANDSIELEITVSTESAIVVTAHLEIIPGGWAG